MKKKFKINETQVVEIKPEKEEKKGNKLKEIFN